MDFIAAFNRVMGHEGGYVNDPNDPGGETKWGISKRSYPHLNIKELTRSQAADIYQKDFWDPLLLDGSSDDALKFQLFDFAVNSGIQTAIRAFQRVLGVADDGHFGPVSREAMLRMSSCDELLLISAERLEFMTRLKNWDKHGKGWARRIAQNMRYAAQDNID